MTEAEWLVSNYPWGMVQFIRGRTGKVSLRYRLGARGLERKQRLFVVACCRRIWSLLPDERSRRSVEAAERYADGMASAAELQSAHDEATAIVVAEARNATAEGRRRSAAMPAAEASQVEFSFNALMRAMDVAALVPADVAGSFAEVDPGVWERERTAQAGLLRDIFGNPFRPVTFLPAWRTDTAVALARQMYESREFSALPILADALQDAGCDNAEVLAHCRGAQEEDSEEPAGGSAAPTAPHVRGCWVVDLVLDKA